MTPRQAIPILFGLGAAAPSLTLWIIVGALDNTPVLLLGLGAGLAAVVGGTAVLPHINAAVARRSRTGAYFRAFGGVLISMLVYATLFGLFEVASGLNSNAAITAAFPAEVIFMFLLFVVLGGIPSMLLAIAFCEGLLLAQRRRPGAT